MARDTVSTPEGSRWKTECVYDGRNRLRLRRDYTWHVALNTPITLSANTAYYLVSHEANGGDQWYDHPGTQVSFRTWRTSGR